MTAESKQIAARATAAKWGGKSPDVRDLARDLLVVMGEMGDALELVERARAVIDHWRASANKIDADDAVATANLPAGEERPIVTYVPASEGLRLAADRLEAALDDGGAR